MLGQHRNRTKLPRSYIRESLRGNRIGQQDREPLRGKSASERVSEREGFQRFLEIFRGFQRFSEIFQRFSEIFQRFQRSSQRPSQRQISLSEVLSPVAPNRVAP